MDAPRAGLPACGSPAARGRRGSGQGLSILNNRQLASDLSDHSEGIRERQRAHVIQYGTLIPHQFMADVLGYVGDCLRAERRGEVAAILECLERAMAQGDRETRNAVALSFARDAELEDFFHHLRPMLGPHLRKQLKYG